MPFGGMDSKTVCVCVCVVADCYGSNDGNFRAFSIIQTVEIADFVSTLHQYATILATEQREECAPKHAHHRHFEYAQ